MQITLRRAHDLELAADAAQKAITIERETLISVHVDNAVQIVQESETTALQRIQKKRELIQARYQLRIICGRANTDSGVSNLLTQKAEIDAVAGMIRAALGLDDNSWRSLAGPAARRGRSEQTIQALPKAIEAARRRLETVTMGSTEGHVHVATLSEKSVSDLHDQLQTLRLQGAALLEQIATLNVTYPIAIQDELFDTLRRHKLL